MNHEAATRRSSASIIPAMMIESRNAMLASSMPVIDVTRTAIFPRAIACRHLYTAARNRGAWRGKSAAPWRLHSRTPTARHRRTATTGYPSCGCVAAEPHAVSPADSGILYRLFQFNTSSNTETHASKNPTPLSAHCKKNEFENLFSNLSLTLFKTIADTFSAS